MKSKEKSGILFVFILFSVVGTAMLGMLGFFLAVIIGTLYMILIELSKIAFYLKELSSKE